MYDFSSFKNDIKSTDDWLVKELSQIRTGRATPNILDSVRVDAYGSEMPVSNVATVSSEDPRTLRIAPWDNSMIKPIEKAIQLANLGLAIAIDDKGLRVSFPALTTETRGQFVKMAKAKVEDAKVALRQERNKVNDDLNAKKKEGSMSEDEMMRAKAEVEKLIKEASEKFDSHGAKKEKEIME
ncbi:MAG TPA: ribosome recycling factor [Candidatus Paceibacterota bacterium]|nr:ribosome recycling factor [Candidatus Paceibacterota bacterium]